MRSPPTSQSAQHAHALDQMANFKFLDTGRGRPDTGSPPKKRVRRASSADDTAMGILNGRETQGSGIPKHSEPRRTASASPTEVALDPVQGSVSAAQLPRDNLALRPSEAQRDFFSRRIGYHGFYHQPAFDTGQEPYGYPDKDLPLFRAGEVPDRMSWQEWQHRQKVGKSLTNPTGPKRGDDRVGPSKEERFSARRRRAGEADQDGDTGYEAEQDTAVADGASDRKIARHSRFSLRTAK